MAMTKEEVLKAIRNHSGEMRTIIGTLEFEVLSLEKGYRPEVPGEIDALKTMMNNLKTLADETKDILGEWPAA